MYLFWFGFGWSLDFFLCFLPSLREVIDSPTTTGGGMSKSGSIIQSPPLSPAHDDSTR